MKKKFGIINKRKERRGLVENRILKEEWRDYFIELLGGSEMEASECEE